MSNHVSDRRAGTHSWLIPAGLLLVGLILRLTLAWQDHTQLLSKSILSDDTFLALSVAKNLAAGNGMTADGVNVTNGFQPLYVFLMTPVFALCPAGNLTLPIHIACTLLAFAGTATAWLFYLIARRLFTASAALCVLFFFCLSHYFVVTDVNGLETALYGLLLSGTLYYYLTRFVQSEIPARRHFAALGLLAGLTVLARVDAGIFVLCMAVHLLWTRRRSAANTIHNISVGSAAFLATLAPWLITSLILCKTIVPVSGPAVRFLSPMMGWFPVANLVGYTGPDSFSLDSIPWQYHANSILCLSARALALLPPTAFMQGLGPRFPDMQVHAFPIGQAVARYPWGCLLLVGVGAALATLVAVRRFASSKYPRRTGGLSFLTLAVIGWMAAYAFYVYGPWHSKRYLYPVICILTLWVGGSAGVMLDGVRTKLPNVGRALFVSGAVFYSCLFVIQAGHYFSTPASKIKPDLYSPVLDWLERNTSHPATIAAFQSGILGYFTPGGCINLDGVVNADALDAMRRNRLWEYIRRSEIDYMVDWPLLIERYLGPTAGLADPPLIEISDEHSMHVYEVARER